MINLNNPYLYLKGTCNVVISDIVSGNVDYQSTKVQTNQFTTTCDLGTIRAGLGNAIVAQIPSDSAVNLTLTNADFSMKARGLQVGSAVTYNAVAPVCASVTATGTTISLPDGAEAAAPLGFTKKICYVGNSGTAYTIGADGTVEGFTATSGETYTISYFAAGASNEQVVIGARFAPAVKHVMAQMAVYSTEATSAQNQGTQVGWLYYVIPRMQFAGTADTEGSQSTAATTVLNGSALVYDGPAPDGACVDCANGGVLAYYIYVPLAGTASAVESIVVSGGAITVAAQATKQIPAKYIMKDGSLVQPNYSDLTWTVDTAGAATASVSATGVVTGKTAGKTVVHIAVTANPEITGECNVTVQ